MKCYSSNSLLAIGLFAFTLESPLADTATKKYALEEIIVTARKREEPLRDVPVSVSVLTSKSLDAQSLSSLKETGQYIPNFQFLNNGQAGNSGGVVFIRGIGQIDPNIFWDPGVGIYLDGVYLARMQGIDLDLSGLDRVEVLRGPQGTLFGKNTIGGAVNIVTRKPDDDFDANAELIVGRFDRLDAQLYFNVPVVDDILAVNFSASGRSRDGFGTRQNFITGEEIDSSGDQDRQNFRKQTAWNINSDMTLLWSVDGARIRENGAVREVRAFATPTLVGLLNGAVEPDYSAETFSTGKKFVSNATGSNKNDLDVFGTSLIWEWGLDTLVFKSITAYRDTEAENGTDPDGSPYTLIDLQQDINHEQLSQEFQWHGRALDEKIQWMTGVFYFEEETYSNEILSVFSEIFPGFGPDLSFTRNIWSDAKSYAVFGQATMALTDALDITAGLRYSEEEKIVARERLAHVTSDVLAPKGRKKERFDAFSPRLSVTYNWSDDIMGYVSVARGFKSGGINGDSFNEFTFSTFKPEKVWTYEFGVRAGFLDQQLRFNASAFYSDYSDIQFTVRRGDPDTGRSVALVDNAGKARMQGLEVELLARPTEFLSLSFGAGYIDAEYTEVDPALPITKATNFSKTPEKSFSLTGEYRWPLNKKGELISHLGWAYHSEIHHDILNSPYGLQDSYSLLDARVTYAGADDSWQMAVFGTNLTDERYITAVTDFTASLGFAEVQWARPREWGLSVSVSF